MAKSIYRHIIKYISMYRHELLMSTLALVQILFFMSFFGCSLKFLSQIPQFSIVRYAALTSLFCYLIFALYYLFLPVLRRRIPLESSSIWSHVGLVYSGLMLVVFMNSATLFYSEIDIILNEYNNHIVSIILGIVFARLFLFNPLPNRYSFSYEARTAIPFNSIKINKDVRWMVSVHEAGHALMLAAIPEEQRTIVRASSLLTLDNTGVRGRVVWFPKECIDNESKLFSQIQLLVSLAGMSAERHIFMQHYSGGRGDLIKWYRNAKNYHLQGFGYHFYPEPDNKFESLHNSKVLMNLLKKHRLILTEFMIINERVLLDLAKELNEKVNLSGQEIEVYLKDVEFPKMFPRITLTESLLGSTVGG